jgi:hypothetical protein
LFDEGAQNSKRIHLSILALSGFVAGRMRACLPRQLVTNGTIFLLRRYVLANVPFVIWRPCPSAHTSSVRYTQIGENEEFSGIAGVVLLVEKCEESEVSELSQIERSGVAQKRLRFVFLEFL